MKLTDSLIPYQLMSMHPLMHSSLLLTGFVLSNLYKDKFYEIGQCDAKSVDGKSFIVDGKYSLMQKALLSHGVGITLHFLYQILNHYEYKVLANFVYCAKMLACLWLVLEIQSRIDFTDCAQVIGESQVMSWLTFEVLCFYLNLISIGAFILVNHLKTFKSIRDRLGLAGQARKKLDFLAYSQFDLHWWSAWFTQVGVCVLTLVLKNDKGYDITQTVIFVFSKHVLGMFLIRQLYFNSKFQFKLNTKIVLFITVILNFVLVYNFFSLQNNNQKMWAAAVLNDIFLYTVIFVQMIIEFFSWRSKLIKWRQELCLEQMLYKSVDQTEGKLTFDLNQKAQDLYGSEGDESAMIEEKLPLEEDQSIKGEKSLKIGSTMYSACYFAFMKDIKKKHKWTEADQFELFWKTLLTLTVQSFFIYCLVFITKVKFGLTNDTLIQFCLFFSVLLLHLSCIDSCRSGLYMMKYVVCHPEKFTHPRLAFLLGFIQLSSTCIIELLNLASVSGKTKAQDVITGYMGYGAVLSFPSTYMGAIHNFPIKADIGPVKVKNGRKEVYRTGNSLGFLFNLVYVLAKWFYSSFYFYFFTLSFIFIPLVKILYEKEKLEQAKQ